MEPIEPIRPIKPIKPIKPTKSIKPIKHPKPNYGELKLWQQHVNYHTWSSTTLNQLKQNKKNKKNKTNKTSKPRKVLFFKNKTVELWNYVNNMLTWSPQS